MSHSITVKEKNIPIYDISIEPDYSKFHQIIAAFCKKDGKVCIVSDSNVSIHYLKNVQEITKQYAKEVITFTLTAGEEYKNLDSVSQVYEYLIRAQFDRHDLLIALGGGVIGDLTGFTAATYLRGIPFIQMPTSLLAMVDSSIGGKTGVDFLKYKNMVGSFHQPKAVYINLETLFTLNEEQYNSGFGEVIKYGLIRDIEYYHWLKDHAKVLMNKELNALEEMIFRSCNNKEIVVDNDPTEQGERALLNFGHTIGHAIEKLMNFTMYHGNCVSVGMVAASYISYQRGYLKKEKMDDIIETLTQFHLPTTIKKLDVNQVIAATKNDKKMESGKIKFILLKSMGNAYIDKTVTDEEMREAIEFIMR
jgi:3-dehydroquinate synthase